jgi:Ca2+-binding EF-hand superfamily protein
MLDFFIFFLVLASIWLSFFNNSSTATTVPPLQQQKKKMTEKKYRVKYEFKAEHADELSVKLGEIVASDYREEDGWLKVKVSRRGANGQNQTIEGLVPVSYLQEEATPTAPPLPAGRRAPPPVPMSVSSVASTVKPSIAEEHAECTICYVEMHERPAAVLLGGPNKDKRVCRHFLHLECAENLLKSNGARSCCPLCRSPFTAVKRVPDFDIDPHAWFKCVDADGSGSLSKSEVLEVLKALLAVDYQALERNVDSLWSRWDMDGSGEVDYQELCDKKTGLLVYVRSHFARKKMLPPPRLTLSTREEWFHFWDEDGNGTLEEEEIVRALVKTFQIRPEKIGETRDTVRAVWGIFDVDNSGAVDLSEFISRDGLGETLIASLAGR